MRRRTMISIETIARIPDAPISLILVWSLTIFDETLGTEAIRAAAAIVPSALTSALLRRVGAWS